MWRGRSQAELAVANQRKFQWWSPVWTKQIPKPLAGRARQSQKHWKHSCCFSVAAHGLLFIICTVLRSSCQRPLLRDTEPEKDAFDFSVAAQILLNSLELCPDSLSFSSMNYRYAPRCCSLFLLFFSLHCFPWWADSLSQLEWSLVSERTFVPFSLSKSPGDSSTCLSSPYSNTFKSRLRIPSPKLCPFIGSTSPLSARSEPLHLLSRFLLYSSRADLLRGL